MNAAADGLRRHSASLCGSASGHGYAVWDGEVFRLTPAGMVVQNAILEELM